VITRKVDTHVIPKEVKHRVITRKVDTCVIPREVDTRVIPEVLS